MAFVLSTLVICKLETMQALGVLRNYKGGTTSEFRQVRITAEGKATFVGDVRVGENENNGVILTSPNGTEYRLVVADDGSLSTVAA